MSNPWLSNSQWSLKYVYDGNGNLTSKTDARNVTTSYGYDAIYRNVSVGYSDGTPTVERHYDGPIGNGKGRLYYHVSLNLNPTQSPPNNYAYSRLVIGGYDGVGRVTSQSQGFLNNTATTWADYQVSRTYDLAGHTLTQTYPSGRSVSHSYASSGRLNSFGGNIGDGSSRTYADTFSYHPAGMITKERFATQTNLYHNSRYNKRLQMVETRLGTSSTDPTTWTRGGILFYWSKKARDAYNPYSEQDDNSGNLMRMEHYVPTADLPDPSTSYVVSQRDNYEYDGLNRLQSLSEDQRQSNGTWNNAVTTQTYSYDRWGNRTAVAGFNTQSYDATETSATNRRSGFSSQPLFIIKKGCAIVIAQP